MTVATVLYSASVCGSLWEREHGGWGYDWATLSLGDLVLQVGCWAQGKLVVAKSKEVKTGWSNS
jgi:hypothetical protein